MASIFSGKAMHLLEFFDCIRIINLADRSDRRKEVIRELDRVGLPLEKGRVEIYTAFRPQHAGGFATVGARGCFLSHLEILRQAQKEKVRYLAVIEDDITFDPKFCNLKEPTAAAIAELDWDLLWLGHLEACNRNRELMFERHNKSLLTTHFYAVNGKTIARIVDAFEAMLARPAGHSEGGPMYPDGAFNTFCQQNPDIIRLVAMPSLAIQRSSRSDVTPKGLVNTLPVVRTIADRYRTVRNRVKGMFAH